MAGASDRDLAVSAMAAAQHPRPLLARGQRSRAMAVCTLHRRQHHGRDARENASRGRYHCAELFRRDAAVARSRRRAARSHAVVDHRARDRLADRARLDRLIRAFPRHRQSRLFRRQDRAAAAGVADPDRRRDRTVPARPGTAAPMIAIMPWLGLGLLLLVGLGIVFTGLPAAVVLLTVACFGAALGALSGDVPVQLLGVLPERLINLLENDLLQAIPLYVLMGTLINRLPVAEALYRCSLAVLSGPAAPAVSGIVLGGLLGPMNGSVGASVLALGRVVEPRLAASGMPLPRRAAIIAVASTLGVVVPPSLVLILLGDAMLNAHTIAVTATGRDDRVINTQDVFHGALAPAGLYLAACLVLSWWCNRRGKPDPAAVREAKPRPTIQQAVLATVTLLAILILLGGVATGYFYAVEAAAMGGFTLLIAVLSARCRDHVDAGLAHSRHRPAGWHLDRRHSGRHARRDARGARGDRAKRAGA